MTRRLITRRRALWFVALALSLCAPRSPLRAQETQSVESFVQAARTAARRYTDRREAILDGYRRLGPDFPGMGEHWVNPGRAVSGIFRGEAPPVLTYITTPGGAELAGMAYAVPLRGDESPPDSPFDRGEWHDHSGAILEESLLLEHPPSIAVGAPSFRLSMLHLWLPLENPDGLTRQNNWVLPFLRAGLEPPQRPGSAAARGLSLGSETIGYYEELIAWATNMGSEERHALIDILQRSAASVDRWLEVRRGQALGPDDLRDLESFWNSFWSELEDSISEESFEALRPLRDRAH